MSTDFELIGGRLCLDFANTVSSYLVTPRKDQLADYDDLLRWSVQAAALDADEAAQMRKEAARRPMDAAVALARAVALREAIYTLFQAKASGERLPAAALETLNESLGSLAAQRLIVDDGECRLECAHTGSLDGMLGPIARSAAELLASGEVARVRLCEASAHGSCTWLFLDTSKNRSRRWCSMRDCGNRAKARRHYQRSRE